MTILLFLNHVEILKTPILSPISIFKYILKVTVAFLVHFEEYLSICIFVKGELLGSKYTKMAAMTLKTHLRSRVRAQNERLEKLDMNKE